MRNGEKIWYCTRNNVPNAEVESFTSPKELILRMPTAFSPVSVTVQPLSGFTDIMAYGESASKNQRIVLTPYKKWLGVFNRGDLFYLDGAKPQEDENYPGEYANFVVDDVSNQNESIEIIVKKIMEK